MCSSWLTARLILVVSFMVKPPSEMLVCLASHACACATLASQLSQPFQHVKTGAKPHLQKNILSGPYANRREYFFGLDMLERLWHTFPDYPQSISSGSKTGRCSWKSISSSNSFLVSGFIGLSGFLSSMLIVLHCQTFHLLFVDQPLLFLLRFR